MSTRSSLSSKWNSNKPTHSVLVGECLAKTHRQCLDWTGLDRSEVWMWRNEVGVLGIYRYLQQVTSSHTSARVSAHMLPVTCAATHGYTHVVRHVPDTFMETHSRPHVPHHDQPSCVATHRLMHVSPYA
ncbi:hypothetical protein F2Q70_00022206 [Brassica cretica]|uniref:Uncharacterized protein n=1 Tax=Brassica cretica TaxID=69181 RepID=A0A8S9GUI3_BRACR|nr:hypothetical protein F2Q70_00022206 [Brassica cretica]KAF3605663.1 hypothetical protein DY000_02048633 [Brassica cretica]